MNERRITPGTDNRHDPLKEIAGRLQSLSYRDMQRFSRILADCTNIEFSEDMSEGLLAASDQILSEKN